MAQSASPYEDNLIEKLEKKELMSSFYKAVDMLPAQKRGYLLDESTRGTDKSGNCGTDESIRKYYQDALFGSVETSP